MSNRRLVATPTRKPRPAKTQAAQPAAMIAPSGLKSWHAFALLLIVIAIICVLFQATADRRRPAGRFALGPGAGLASAIAFRERCWCC